MRALLALVVLFHVPDARIDEASGIGRGIRSPGVVYVQNDSGDSARFFALDLRTGATAATVTVPDATNVDWEDLAVAPDAAGTPSVWLGDIGDNDAKRSEIRIYRVDEPSIASTARGRTVSTGRPDVWRLRYPGGARNAEGLAVGPDGRAYIVTKSMDESEVYAVPARPSSSVQTLTRIATIRFPGSLFPLATGAALSRDGRLFAVRTYTEAYLWTVADGNLPAALATTPRLVELPTQKQGEGIAIDGSRLLVDSEGKHQPVYAVPIPPATSPSSSTSSSPRASATPTPSVAAARHHGTARWGVAGAAAGGALVLLAAVAWFRRRRAAG